MKILLGISDGRCLFGDTFARPVFSDGGQHLRTIALIMPMAMVIRGSPSPDAGMVGYLLAIKNLRIQNSEEFQIILMSLEFLSDGQEVRTYLLEDGFVSSVFEDDCLPIK